MKQFDKIYSVVAKIPKGRVMTYGQVAKLAKINNPRFVGFALHQNSDPKNIPCHRIVRSDGTLATGYAFGGMKKQKEKLEKEGISFNRNFVDLDNYELKK